MTTPEALNELADRVEREECLRARCMYPDGFTRQPATVRNGSCPRCGTLYAALRARAADMQACAPEQKGSEQ